MMAFRDALACWHRQDAAAKETWYEQAIALGHTNYYNFFMAETMRQFNLGVIPAWCQDAPAGGPLLEMRKSWWSYSNDEEGTFQEGDTIKIKARMAAVDLYYDYDEYWQEENSDRFEFQVLLRNRWEWMDRFGMGLFVLGGDNCGSWSNSTTDYLPNWYYHSKSARVNELKYTNIESEVTLPDFGKDLHLLYFSIWTNLLTGGDHESDGVAWLESVEVLHNGSSVLTFDNGDPPAEDPSPGTGNNKIKPNATPWSRWGRTAPSCEGG
jgi:hypothetical protein